MKILYFSFVDISLPKGPSVNEREFVLSLSKILKDKVDFIIPKPKSTIEDALPRNISFIRSAKRHQIPQWILQQREMVKTVKSLLNKNEYDLMIIRCDIFDFAIRAITKSTTVPYALKTAGSGQFNIFKEKNALIRLLYPINQRIFNKIVQNALAVDVVSTIQKQSLEEITGVENKVHFIDNGVNTDRFVIKDKLKIRDKLGLAHFDQIIGYVGGSPWERGGLQIIEALPELLKTYPKMAGVIVGGGSKMDILYNKAKELKVEDHIIFAGLRPFEEMNDYINSFDIGISQLYKHSQGASEQKVRQYLSCGKPILVSPGAVNNFVEQEKLGFIVQDPYNIKEFVEKVELLFQLKNNEKLKSADLIRKYAIENLSVDSKVKQRIDLYKNSFSKKSIK